MLKEAQLLAWTGRPRLRLTASVPSGGRLSQSSREAWAACTACMLELMVPVSACWAEVCRSDRKHSSDLRHPSATPPSALRHASATPPCVQHPSHLMTRLIGR